MNILNQVVTLKKNYVEKILQLIWQSNTKKQQVAHLIKHCNFFVEHTLIFLFYLLLQKLLYFLVFSFSVK